MYDSISNCNFLISVTKHSASCMALSCATDSMVDYVYMGEGAHFDCAGASCKCNAIETIQRYGMNDLIRSAAIRQTKYGYFMCGINFPVWFMPHFVIDRPTMPIAEIFYSVIECSSNVLLYHPKITSIYYFFVQKKGPEKRTTLMLNEENNICMSSTNGHRT